MNKVFNSSAEAISDITDNASIMVGGFGLCGMPENLLEALHHKNTQNLTVICNNAGVNNLGLGKIFANRQIKKFIASYVGESHIFSELYFKGELEVEFVPQGTLAERIRTGGAGIPAFYTPTGVGTIVEEGKDTRVFNGRRYILETALHADFALVKAWKGDRLGNLVYRKSARNFNAAMATAAKITIAEVEELVDVGEIDPDEVHTPGVYVKRILQGEKYDKPVEFVITRD